MLMIFSFPFTFICHEVAISDWSKMLLFLLSTNQGAQNCKQTGFVTSSCGGAVAWRSGNAHDL